MLRQLSTLQTALAERVASLLGRQAVNVTLLSSTVAATFTPPYLRADEAARRLGKPPFWLYRHAERLPFCRKVGRQVLISEPALAAWMTESRGT